MKTPRAWLPLLVLLVLAASVAAGPATAINDRLARATEVLFGRPPPGTPELRRLLADVTAIPRDRLSDDDWLDLHLLVMEVRRRLDPQPAAAATAAELPPPPPVPVLAGQDSALALLDLASEVPELPPVPGAGNTPADLKVAYRNAAKRAAELGDAAAGIAGGACDVLVRTAARVLEERAMDLAFDLRMVSESRLPCGQDRFVWLLANRHRLFVTPEEAVRIGEEEFRRTEADMRKVADAVRRGMTWGQLVEIYRADSAGDAEGLLDLATAITREAEEVAAASGLITVPPAARAPAVRMVGAPFPAPYAHYRPGRLAADGRFDGFAAYTPIPEDLTPGERRTRLRERDRHFLRAVCPHEAVPGHHLQYAIAAGVRRPLRGLGHNSSYVEGWGLYSEDLMDRLGFFASPADRLAFLRMRLWRAARVVIDVGLHTGGLRPSAAVRVLTDQVLLSRSAAEAEVARYLAMPTQPLSYLLGMRRILAIRRAYLALNGASEERSFNDRFLALSPVPLDLAAAVLLEKRKSYDRANP